MQIYRMAQNKMSHQSKCKFSTADDIFLPKFQVLYRKDFSTILENFTRKFSLLQKSVFKILYSTFSKLCRKMDSYL